MASNSYIQKNPDILEGNVGKRLMINIQRIQRVKGVRATDIPIPSKGPQDRALFPLSGEINDFNVTISLENDPNPNIGYSVAVPSNNLSPLGIKTVKEQYIFLYDEILGSGITSSYTLYLDWLDKRYFGMLFIDSDVDPRDFSGQVEVTLQFKEGKNWFSTNSDI